MLKVYGSEMCPDCIECKYNLDRNNIEYGLGKLFYSAGNRGCASCSSLRNWLFMKESVMITSGKFCEFEGTLVILKAGSKLKEIKEKASAYNKNVYMIENCGMPDEKVYYDLHSIPDEAGYFSLMIVR